MKRARFLPLLVMRFKGLLVFNTDDSMPREGAILADNDPRMAATLELRN